VIEVVSKLLKGPPLQAKLFASVFSASSLPAVLQAPIALSGGSETPIPGDCQPETE